MLTHEFDENIRNSWIVEASRNVDEFLSYFEDRLKSILWHISGDNGFNDLKDCFLTEFISFFERRFSLDSSL